MKKPFDQLLRLQLELVRVKRELAACQETDKSKQQESTEISTNSAAEAMGQVAVLRDLLEKLMRLSSKATSAKFVDWIETRFAIQEILQETRITGNRLKRQNQALFARKTLIDLQMWFITPGTSAQGLLDQLVNYMAFELSRLYPKKRKKKKKLVNTNAEPEAQKEDTPLNVEFSIGQNAS